MATIQKRVEPRRGCGYRQPGGMYLVGAQRWFPCCKLPFELSVCPVCNQGIHPGRGWEWIDFQIFKSSPCTKPLDIDGLDYSQLCPIHNGTGKLGLLWVGEKYYPTAAHFAQEARVQGISKRIEQIPRDLVIWQTWVALAHRKAIVDYSEGMTAETIRYQPGIFSIFFLTAIEYVVTNTETPEELDALENRGLTLVAVTKDEDLQKDAFDDDPDPAVSKQSVPLYLSDGKLWHKQEPEEGNIDE